jgi:hypothetical protein
MNFNRFEQRTKGIEREVMEDVEMEDEVYK